MYTYVNGNYVDAHDAVISVQDRGFRFGDGVFETIRVVNAAPFGLELHLKRLASGLDALKINAKLDEVQSMVGELIKRNQLSQGFVRIAVSRGVGSHGYLPVETIVPTIIGEVVPQVETSHDPELLWVSNYQRLYGKRYPSAAKLMQGVNSIMARLEAKENDCFEALLTDGTFISEGSSSNIFWLKDDVIYTPSLECGGVAGVIRQLLLASKTLKIKEAKASLQMLEDVEAVACTNVAWLVKPICKIEPLGWQYSSQSLANKLLDAITHQMRLECGA